MLVLVYTFALLLVSPPALTAGLTAEEIMQQVAENQRRSVSARSAIVYTQNVKIRLLRGGGKLAREENHRFTIAPSDEGFTKKRTEFRGVLRHNNQLMPYAEPHYERGMVDLDAFVSAELAELVDNNSRDGISENLFPLTANQQHKYEFTLLGTETLENREVYRVAFKPRKQGVPKENRGQWQGEVFVDTTQLQPVYVTTTFVWSVPLPIRVVFGTNVRQVGFALRYEEVDDGIWFPVSYGGEFKIRAAFLYGRTATISLTNEDFRRTDVESRISYGDVAAMPDEEHLDREGGPAYTR